MVLAVVAHQAHVEADHPLDPLGHVGEAAGALLRGHVGAGLVEALDGDAGRAEAALHLVCGDHVHGRDLMAARCPAG